MVQCGSGSSTTTFSPPDRGITVGNGFIGTECDTLPEHFVGDFGICKITNSPCAMSFLPKWYSPSIGVKYRVDDFVLATALSRTDNLDTAEPASEAWLIMKSSLVCTKGDKVVFVTDGQEFGATDYSQNTNNNPSTGISNIGVTNYNSQTGISNQTSSKKHKDTYVAQDEAPKIPLPGPKNLDLSMESVTVGKRTYSAQSGTLSYRDEALIQELCEASGVDYYLVFAIILHESSCKPEKTNPQSGAAGLMQIMPGNWSAYTSESGQYYERYKNLREIGSKYDADFSDMLNTAANITVGVSMILEWRRILKTDDMQTIIGGYGEGKNSAATYEILYYRDYMANAAGKSTWYVGKLYTLDGKRLE